MPIEIRIQGLDAYNGKLQRVTVQMPATLQRLMVKSVIYAQSQIPSYPAPPAGSKYRRTGSLGRVVTSFPGQSGGRSIGGGGGGGEAGVPLTRVEMMGKDVRGVIGGRLSYLPDVVGEGVQARVHRSRWWTLERVIKDARGGMAKIFRAGVIEMFK